ncbi:MAG: MATE family efflux transporter [Bacilli bacterium]|jgi:putative MATE family efflux protein|nr:MATE family efflux transporter [Bacilli bacterium]
MKNKEFIKMALLIALPNIAQQFVINISQMVDNIMVGRLNETAIAGVSIMNQLYFVFTVLILGMCATGGIFITQYKGAHNKEKISEVFRIVLVFATIFGILFFLLITFFPYQIFGIFTKDLVTIEAAIKFASILKFTFLFYPFTLAIGASLRFYGYVKIAMYTSIVATILNIIGNYCLIYGNFGFPRLEILGAGISTLNARIIELIVIVIIMIKLKTPIMINLFKIFSFSTKLLEDVVKKGIPLLSNEFLWSFGIQTLNIIYTFRESNNIAAMSIASVIGNFVFIGMGGMATAIAIIVGDSLGKSKFEHALSDSKILIKLGSFLGLALGIFMLILSLFITQIYNVSIETITKARLCILVYTCFSWLYYLNGCLFYSLRAGGDTKGALIMDSLYTWIIALPIALFLSRFHLYMPLFFFSMQFIDFVKLYIAYRRYHKKRWLVNLTIE